MKKYIRTKYYIAKVDAETEQFIKDNKCARLAFKPFDINNPIGGILLFWDDIIKQANTIEELSDGIIVEEKDKPDKWFIMEINEFKEMDKEEKLYQLKDYNFNVFIKIDKGLIYAAKMNKEGELELI